MAADQWRKSQLATSGVQKIGETAAGRTYTELTENRWWPALSVLLTAKG